MYKSNRYKENLKTVDRNKEYLLGDAVGLLKDSNFAKFDEI